MLRRTTAAVITALYLLYPQGHGYGFSLDYYPLPEGASWKYSLSDFTAQIEGTTLYANLEEAQVSVPGPGRKRLETVFYGTMYNGLLVEGLCRISCEKSAPIFAGMP